jgi:hypothetical protein
MGCVPDAGATVHRNGTADGTDDLISRTFGGSAIRVKQSRRLIP